MSRAILISIKPEWVGKILNGEKTIEIRKTMPKCELPCKVYIYCTKNRHLACVVNKNGAELFYTCNNETAFIVGGYLGNGKVVAEFTLNKVDTLDICDPYVIVNDIQASWDYFEKHGLLTYEQAMDYLGGGYDNGWSKKWDTGYAWNIDNLKIYDKPKELSEFKVYDKAYDNLGAFGWAFGYVEKYHPLTRAPQSWCYVEGK